MMALDEYQALVDRCAAERLNLPIANGTAEHARILIHKLFEIARKHVVIVSGHLTDLNQDNVDVYGHEPVIAAAKKFLTDKTATLQIILMDGELDRGNGNRLLRALADDPARKGDVRLIIPGEDVLSGKTPHFMVCDRFAYRFEQDPDPKKTEAIANFGDARWGRRLAEYFDVLMAGLIESKKLLSDTTLRANEPLIA